MQLNFKEKGSGKPLLILHGFMGSLDNWHTLASQFGESHHVFSIDQRNHGKSPHTESHSIALMVSDLLEFIQTRSFEKVTLLGHSMGGKVVMQFALNYPNLVEKLIIVDISPKQYHPGHDDVFKAIFAVDLTKIKSRKEAELAMIPYMDDLKTRQFLLKNIERKPNGEYQWKMNLSTLHKDYEEMIKPIEPGEPYLGKTLFIKGEKSKYIIEEDRKDISALFPNFEIKSIANAGHWVHSENPKDFYQTVTNFL